MANDGTEIGPENTTNDVVRSPADSTDGAAGASGAGSRKRRAGNRARTEQHSVAASKSAAAREVPSYPAVSDYGIDHTADGNSNAADGHAVTEPVELEEPVRVSKGKPYESLGQSARNHWQLVAACALVGVLLGAAFGFKKTPNYTAEARLLVGKTAQLSNLASIPGLDAAGQSLAASYSRLASTDEVLRATAKALGGTIDGTLSASPIPQSPIVLVEGTASTSERALAIARAGSKALVSAVDRLNTDQSNAGDGILKQYEQADLALVAAQAKLQSLKTQLADAQTANRSPAVIADLQQQVNAAQTVVDGNQVKVTALADAYSGVFNPTALNTQVLQVVGPPAATGSDRKSTLEMGLLVGVVAGSLLGLGLAALIDLRARRAA